MQLAGDLFAPAAYLPTVLMAMVAVWAHRQSGRSPVTVVRAALFATGSAVVVAILAAVFVFGGGPRVAHIGWLTLRLDALSVVMVSLVAFLGLLLVRYSRNYLDGDPRHAVFVGELCLTIGAVLLLVLAGNLTQLAVGWIGASLALHRLLTFYGDRRRAVVAARKKFLLARLSDVLFVIAAVLFARAFGTGDLGALVDAARSMDAAPAGVGIATVLVALAAALKSAMFPIHGWLLEVMETPTPVSALLHAGLLNAGTFLVVRLGDVMFLNPGALHLLIAIGGFTAIFASSAMITQSSVKVSLAYSSAAHMGFMLLLCGFGAHSVAIMHLVAHSFYKAHAFLSSGSIVEYAGATGKEKLHVAPRPLVLVASVVIAAAIFVSLGTALGIDLTKRPGEAALGVIFVMAVTQLVQKALAGAPQRGVLLRVAGAAVAVTLAFFALELSAAWILGDAVAVYPPPTPVTLAVMAIAVFAFGVIIVLQALLPALAHTPAWRTLYVHLKNGFYANALFDRLIGALR